MNQLSHARTDVRFDVGAGCICSARPDLCRGPVVRNIGYAQQGSTAIHVIGCCESSVILNHHLILNGFRLTQTVTVHIIFIISRGSICYSNQHCYGSPAPIQYKERDYSEE
jgi:hypothetical protein